MKIRYDVLLGRMREYDEPTVVPSGLQIHLPLRNSDGDISPRQLTPVAAGTVTFASNWAKFTAPRVYDFGETGMTQMTISGNFLVPMSIPMTGAFDICGITSPAKSFYLSKFSGNAFAIVSSGTPFQAMINAILTASPFHFIATYDGYTVRGYLNGVEVLSTAATLAVFKPLFNIWANGINVSDLRFYNIALNAAEVVAIYQADKR